jgi:hypothetical protein
MPACGGSHTSSTAPAAERSFGATVRTADCNQWRVLTPADREKLLVAMRTFFGGPVGGSGARGQVVPDKQAYGLLQRYCRQSFAGTFKLYKIYGRAAAFNPAASP